MFHYNNFFDLGPFLTFHSNVMDQKMAGAKKVVKTKNQFFHACQLRKGIFEIHSHRCCILRTCFQIFYWLPLFQELKFSAKNQLVQCFSTCRIRISWLLLHLRVTGLHYTLAGQKQQCPRCSMKTILTPPGCPWVSLYQKLGGQSKSISLVQSLRRELRILAPSSLHYTLYYSSRLGSQFHKIP